MVAIEILGEFEDGDRFLRRVRFKDHIKNGILAARAFKETDDTLSWTIQDGSLKTDAAIDEYQSHIEFKGGRERHPGIVWLSYLALTEMVEPPLEPCKSPDKTDPKYGHLHCTTDVPNKGQRRALAKIVLDKVEGKILRDVIVRLD